MNDCLFLGLISALLSVVLGFVTIPILKKLKMGQTILSYVSEHKQKNGTPTMGGLFFTLSAILIYAVFCGFDFGVSTVTVAITLGFMCVGLIDDFLKIKNDRNLGLKPYQKIIFQLVISIIASVYAYNSGIDFVYIPFTFKRLYLGLWCIPIYVFIFIATVNCVNLTDGLDGLAAGVSSVYATAISVIITLQISASPSIYVKLVEYENLTKLYACYTGALLGYLLFNVSKASVFMGDTGSLSLGGLIASGSVLSGNSLNIAVLGVFFVFSGISVILQVIYFKRTGKRIFLMSPLHHHFQHKGYSESKICYAYSFITALISALFIVILRS